jgi:dTDP-4-amino-4,6-dideoxygalactose transaminase
VTQPAAGSRGARRSVPLARPSFGAAEEDALRDVLRSGWVTQGPRVAEFERRFAVRVGAAEAVAVSSGTTALFLALHALGIGPGDEVIVPSLSFIASANCIAHCGATPVFADVDPRSYNLDPEAVRAALSPRSRALLAVHQLGVPAELDALQQIARSHGLPLVEDAACAVGARYQGRPIGSSGNLACFSFHPRKLLVTGEGGMITTDDPALAARLRILRHQGMSVSDLERHLADRTIVERYPEIGYNFRLSDLHAALGLVQLEKLDLFLARRSQIAARYARALADLAELELPFCPAQAEPNHQSYIVRLTGASAEQRDGLMDALLQRGIATRRGLMACHREPPYQASRHGSSLAHTEAAADQTLLLPIYSELEPEDQDYVVDQLRELAPKAVAR